MQRVHVPALKPLVYEGRSYVRGDLVLMQAVDAAVAARRGEVSLTRGLVLTRDVEAESAPQAPTVTTPRRRYRRRDLTAESS